MALPKLYVEGFTHAKRAVQNQLVSNINSLQRRANLALTKERRATEERINQLKTFSSRLETMEPNEEDRASFNQGE